ncbi:MAG: Fe-S cluster assembly ATPase SufC [Bacilli bacterium]
MLKIDNLEVYTDNKKILDNFNLIINDGEIHTIMGPNGVGKSTLSRVIMGDSNYKITSGNIIFNGDNLIPLSTDERAKKGIFLAMQYPMEIEGVSNQDFLRTAISEINNKRIGLYDFILKCEKGAEELAMSKELIHRSLNVGFSGGEKKKNEVLQIKLFKPQFIILDELDSGLDVDSLKIVGENIKKYKEENPSTSILIITHHPKILEYLKPNYVHILNNGTITKTGNYNLAIEIEKNGYNEYKNSKSNVTRGE